MSHTRRDILQMLAVGAPLVALPHADKVAFPAAPTPLEPETSLGALSGSAAPPGTWKLSVDADSGATSITVNTAPDAALAGHGWVIIDPFTTGCEFRKITSISGTSITFTPVLTYDHDINDTVLWTSEPVLSVSLFGALLDGTDDRVAVDAAIANAGLLGGGEVVIPRGSTAVVTLDQSSQSEAAPYHRALTLRSNVTITGGGTIKLANSQNSYGGIFCQSAASGALENVTIRDLTIDMNGDYNEVPGGEGTYHYGAITLYRAINLRIQNVTFKNVDSVKTVCVDSGGNTLDEVRDVWVEGCRFEDVGRYNSNNHDGSVIYIVTSGGAATIRGNKFKGYAVGLLSLRAAIETSGSNITVDDNDVENFPTAFQISGVRTGNVSDQQIIANNRIRGCRTGIQIQSSLSNTVSIKGVEWQWQQDGVSERYYLQTAAGGNPGIALPGAILENGKKLTFRAFTDLANLARGEWSYGDMGGGYSTIVVRLYNAGHGTGPDPDANTAVTSLTYVASQYLLTAAFRKAVITGNVIDVDSSGWYALALASNTDLSFTPAAIKFHSDASGRFEDVLVEENIITYSGLIAPSVYPSQEQYYSGIQLYDWSCLTGDTAYSSVKIRGNLIRGCPGAGIEVWTERSRVFGLTIEGNEIVNPGAHPSTSTSVMPDEQRVGVRIRVAEISNSRIADNNIYDSRGTAKMKHGVHYSIGSRQRNTDIVNNQVRAHSNPAVPHLYISVPDEEGPYVRHHTHETPFAAPTFLAKYGSEIVAQASGVTYRQHMGNTSYFSGTRWEAEGAPSMSVGTGLATFQTIPGLRAFWPFSSYDQVAEVMDFSGQGRTLTDTSILGFGLSGLITYGSLNGAASYFYRPDEAGLQLTSTLSMGGWFWLDDLDSEQWLMGKWNETINNQRAYGLLVNTNGSVTGQISTDGNGGATVYSHTTGTGVVTAGRWIFYAMSYDVDAGLTLYIYDPITGVATVTSKTTSPRGSVYGLGAARFVVGAKNDGAAGFLDGRCAWLFLSASSLNGTIIANLFNQSRYLFG